MSETQTRALNVTLPMNLVRQIKIDAARQDKPLLRWVQEAAEAKLRESQETAVA